MDEPEFRLEMGAAWLNLLSTVHGRRRDRLQDFIDSPPRLGRWFDAVGLTPQRRPGPADLVDAHRLRENLYAVARAVADGRPVPRAAVRVMNEALAADAVRPVSIAAGRLRAARPADTREALARLARQAADQLTSVDPPRLRACGDDTCAGIFVDDSGRRRWCNDTRCGSRARVRAYRSRQGGASH
jgi:predicted RNA-binding Zn ribbon-like protein